MILSFVRPGCLFFCRSGLPVVTVDQFLGLVGHLLPQEPPFDLPRITGRDLEVAWAKVKGLLLGGQMVGLGMRSKRFHFLGSLVWLFCSSWLRLLVFGLRVCWMPILL